MPRLYKTVSLRLTAPSPLPAPKFDEEIQPLIVEALKGDKKESLLKSAQIAIDCDENFPTLGAAETLVLFHFVTKVAYDVFRATILPALKRNYAVKATERTRPPDASKKAPAKAPTTKKPSLKNADRNPAARSGKKRA